MCTLGKGDGKVKIIWGAWGTMTGDGEVAVELGETGSVSGADETGLTEYRRIRRGERESGGGGNEILGSAMTTKGGKPSRGDAVVGVGESEGGEKKGESSWKVTLAEVI